MITDKGITAASYSGGAVSIFSAMTLTDWGILVGIVTALATFALNVWWGMRRQQVALRAGCARKQARRGRGKPWQISQHKYFKETK